MGHNGWAKILEAALVQDGAASVAQLRALGVTEGQLKRMVAAGVLDRPERGVVRVVGTEPSWQQEQRIAMLRAGPPGVGSHRAAAHLFVLEGIELVPVELTVPYDHRTIPKIGIVHRSTDLTRAETTSRRGFRVTNPTRTLVDLGAVVTSSQLEVALDDALRRGLTTDERLWEAVHRLGRSGRAGVPQIRALLIERGVVDSTTDTGFETLLLRVLRRHGLPRPVTQHELFDHHGRFVMRFDAAYPELKVGIEADSERWHMNRQRFITERTQRARAVALGWRVLAFTHRHVTREGAFVADTVGRTLATKASA